MARLLRKAKNQKLFDRDFKTSDQIGEGAMGTIFKVVNDDGKVVAAAKHFNLKRYSKSAKEYTGTLKEVSCLGKKTTKNENKIILKIPYLFSRSK